MPVATKTLKSGCEVVISARFNRGEAFVEVAYRKKLPTEEDKAEARDEVEAIMKAIGFTDDGETWKKVQ